MAKWFWKDAGQHGNVEVGTFKEPMRDRYVDGVLKAGVLVEAVISDSENQESAFWCVRENGIIVDSGTTTTIYGENDDDTIWAFDLAQKAAEAVITKMPDPAKVEPVPVSTVVDLPRRKPRSVTNPNYVRQPDLAEATQPYVNSPFQSSSNDDYDESQSHWWENNQPMVASSN